MKNQEEIPATSEIPVSEALDGLIARIARFTEQGELFNTAIPGLGLFRRPEKTEPLCTTYPPCVCLIAQGEKRVEIGNEAYVYDPGHYLVTAVHVPTVVQVTKASEKKPYLGLRLFLDQRELTQLMTDSEMPPPSGGARRSMATSPVTPPLLDAFNRLIDLLETPEDIPILGPVIQREISYRLLTGEQGLRLRQIAATGSQSNQVARAIEWLKGHYAEAFKIDELASRVGMSSSTFHHHFRAMTALSPLQFQKQLRLQEAKRLMVSENLDASSAAFEVGYESPSQFSREYKNLFGAPPMKDVRKLVGGLTG